MTKRYAILLGAALVSACNDRPAEPPALAYDEYAEQLVDTGADRTLLGRQWLEAGRAALQSPMAVTLPYGEAGAFLGHDATAHGYSFAGLAGQTVLIEISRAGEAGPAAGHVYVELFEVDERSGRKRHARVAALPSGESLIEAELPADATYTVRVQPELLADVQYRLTIELEAVLPFPVSGLGTGAVQSLFGAERDAGARHHEGVDIFAPRSTPVLAVADGRAVPRTNRLGGNTVWLTVPGTSYYYAHLEGTELDGARRVRTGEVLGYVGNSGNAATTPPHLHFGVYRWGKGPIDPLPLLGAGHFEGELGPARFAPRYGATLASSLSLRSAPARSSRRIELLPEGTIVHATAASGDWLRVRVPERFGARGWIHARYERALGGVLHTWRAPVSMFLRDSPAPLAVPVDFVATGTVLDVLAERDGHRLLRSSATARVGWVPASADPS